MRMTRVEPLAAARALLIVLYGFESEPFDPALGDNLST